MSKRGLVVGRLITVRDENVYFLVRNLVTLHIAPDAFFTGAHYLSEGSAMQGGATALHNSRNEALRSAFAKAQQP